MSINNMLTAQICCFLGCSAACIRFMKMRVIYNLFFYIPICCVTCRALAPTRGEVDLNRHKMRPFGKIDFAATVPRQRGPSKYADIQYLNTAHAAAPPLNWCKSFRMRATHTHTKKPGTRHSKSLFVGHCSRASACVFGPGK